MGNSIRTFIVVLVILFIGVLTTVLLIGGRRTNISTDTQTLNVTVADYINNKNSSVTWTQEGELVGENDRRAIRVTVTPTERRADVLAGYDQKIIKTIKFSNNPTAYASFLLALEELRFGDEKRTNEVDERGVCPFGNRYIYQLHDGADQKMRLWSTTCKKGEGTFDGEANLVKKLFKSQITDYLKFVSGTKYM